MEWSRCSTIIDQPIGGLRASYVAIICIKITILTACESPQVIWPWNCQTVDLWLRLELISVSNQQCVVGRSVWLCDTLWFLCHAHVGIISLAHMHVITILAGVFNPCGGTTEKINRKIFSVWPIRMLPVSLFRYLCM